MSLVDRWLARPLADRGAATSATSATSPKKASITAAIDVASRVRLPATAAEAATGSPGVSQPVADTRRGEKPQNSAAIDDMSQMSQVVMSASDKGEPAAIVEQDGGVPCEVEGTPSEPTLLAPGRWFDRFGSPGEPPFDQPCVPRRGRVERQGGLFLHFCVTCGAWGAFGYGSVGRDPGRWYCREHRPKDEM